MAAKKSKYKVRFRHGVYPNLESQATRADIKKYDYFFGNEQVWVETPETVDFVDESYQDGDDCESLRIPSLVGDQKVSGRRLTCSINRETRWVPPASRRRSRNLDAPTRATIATSNSKADQTTAAHPETLHAWHGASRISGYESSGPETIPSFDDVVPFTWQEDLSSPLTWLPTTLEHLAVPPLKDPFEEHLLQFWVEEASRWWDSTSSYQMFQRVVPTLSLQNSMLRNAILMYSAQHIQRFQPDFPANSFFYHARLLQELVPHLALNGRIEDEGTLVAVILLRAFEDFHGKLLKRHVRTMKLIYSSKYTRPDASARL